MSCISTTMSWCWSRATGWLPDLTDDATGGVLLEMVRKELGKVTSATSELPGSWEVLGYDIGSGHSSFCTFGSTLGEAAAKALLALWGPEENK